jgi:hypothetical protein
VVAEVAPLDVNAPLRRTVAPHHPTWPEAEVSAVAFRCKALGASEATTRAYLGALTAHRVRRLRPFVNGLSDKNLTAILWGLAESEAAERAVGFRAARGDLLRVRTPKHWPWRISTSQDRGGVVA